MTARRLHLRRVRTFGRTASTASDKRQKSAARRVSGIFMEYVERDGGLILTDNCDSSRSRKSRGGHSREGAP